SFRPHQPAALALPAALLFRFPLVMQLLAARERKLDFGAAFLVEIELERDQGHSLALHCSDQLVDLPTVEEQLAHPLWSMIEPPALEIFGDVGIDEPDLASAGIGIGFGDGCLALAQRFYLGSGKRNTGLERLVDLVVETGLAIVRDHARIALPFCCHHASGRLLIVAPTSKGPESPSAVALVWSGAALWQPRNAAAYSSV